MSDRSSAIGVGWGKNGCEIDVGGTYVFKKRRR